MIKKIVRDAYNRANRNGTCKKCGNPTSCESAVAVMEDGTHQTIKIRQCSARCPENIAPPTGVPVEWSTPDWV